MSAKTILSDAAEMGEQAVLLATVAERSANKFHYYTEPGRGQFMEGFIEGATLMASILRPPAASNDESSGDSPEPRP